MATLTRREFLAAAGAGSLALLPGCSQLLDSSADRSLDYLGSKLRGALIRPDHPEFNALSEPRNLRFASTVPQAVALCVDADDIATALLWARETATPFAIRGGGHNYALASTSPGLIISTRAMSRSTVAGNVLRMQAGALNRDLAALLPNGGRGEFLLPGGNCPNVGVTGATLGGGIGPNAPWAGLAADRLTSATVVTASGHIVTANATTNADLFWALRGGAGGNFGIVTDLQYALVPIPVPRATTVRLRYSGIEATVEAFRAWQRIRALAPRLVCGTCQMLPGNSGTNAAIRAQVLATESGARDLLAPLLAIPAALIEIVERPWWDVYAWYVTPPSPNNSFWDRSLYADADLPDAAFARFASVVARFPTGLAGDRGGSLSLFGWVGGAVSDIAPDATAYVHRAARALIEIGTGWATAAARPGSVELIPPDIKAWAEELWDTILPYTTRRSYQNFPDPELNGWDSAYYGSNLARLRAVKAAWDPEGAFTYPQAIPVTKERRYVGFFRRRVEPAAGVVLAA